MEFNFLKYYKNKLELNFLEGWKNMQLQFLERFEGGSMEAHGSILNWLEGGKLHKIETLLQWKYPMAVFSLLLLVRAS